MSMIDVHHLTDDELVTGSERSCRAERAATADLIAHLAEIEARGVHLALGFASLYAYCRGHLGLPEHASYNRMEAARAARRFPVIVPMLGEGRLHLTAVRLLAPYLDGENHLALLGGASGKSKDEVKELLARWFPKPNVKTSIRRVAIDPLSEDSYSMKLTVRRRSVERLRRAQELLSHAVSDGDVDEILYRALGSLIEQEGKKRPGATPRMGARGRRAAAEGSSAATSAGPRADGRKDPSRYVSADVERKVRERDAHACAFVGTDGRRCGERKFLQLHHLKPWITGSLPSVENLSLRCQAHNQHEWKVWVAPIRRGMEVKAAAAPTA
jgi:hypothetical protein